ncbi:DeoR/GlpR family DNA-binding transcription regulator [Paenibacillus cisolokensis]|uniref:DeoR family transcriptional regulator n=1 Tax=Paenibacillus cisolokensis TaxID=1658519 RepID=A0ABQ4NBU1_9BACL|nr:DeoR/GlpR family DNA-binding transcription regulator [Paenibacillus cisolokensis]GIQ65694.1 DeoR family transcriptional regulator [Paenibacillus cisolokensis]
MHAMKRYELIMERLIERKEATVGELSEMLGVSGKTVREDLGKLEERGLLVRVHGGAVLAQSNQWDIFPKREPIVRQAAEKAVIGRRAAALIEPGDIIALDGGSTTLEIARLLDDAPLTVITNDVFIIRELASKEHIRLVVPGGRRVRNILTGPEAVEYVRKLNIRKAFISATAVDAQIGLSIYTSELADFKRALVETAHEVIAVADHTKFGQCALITFAAIDELDAIVTDRKLPAEQAAAYRRPKLKIIDE